MAEKRRRPTRKDAMAAPGGIRIHTGSEEDRKRDDAWKAFYLTGNPDVLVEAGIIEPPIE